MNLRNQYVNLNELGTQNEGYTAETVRASEYDEDSGKDKEGKGDSRRFTDMI